MQSFADKKATYYPSLQWCEELNFHFELLHFRKCALSNDMKALFQCELHFSLIYVSSNNGT